jgi:hypothetical protein
MCDKMALWEVSKHAVVTGVFAGTLAFTVSLMIALIKPLVEFLAIVPIDGYVDAIGLAITMGITYGFATMLLVIQADEDTNLPVFKVVNTLRDNIWTTEKVNGKRYYLSQRFGLYVTKKRRLIYYIPFFGHKKVIV